MPAWQNRINRRNRNGERMNTKEFEKEIPEELLAPLEEEEREKETISRVSLSY